MTKLLREAGPQDAEAVSLILTAAANWLIERGMPLWSLQEVSPQRIRSEMGTHTFVLAEVDGVPAGTLRFQTEDLLIWPEADDEESAFIHKLAVRREFAGGEISRALLDWAAARAKLIGRKYLRLDCESARGRLRKVYEEFGFEHHSDKQVGPHHVARYELLVEQFDVQGRTG